MFRNFVHSSINFGQDILDKWLINNQFLLCFGPAFAKPWCEACLLDLPWWNLNRSPKYAFVDSVTVGFRYDYPIDRLIQSGKYAADYRLVTGLGSLMPKIPNLKSYPIIYPIPISRWGLLRRGFNQTSLLASGIFRSKYYHIDEVSIHKRQFRPDQSTLNAKGRKLNAHTLFSAKTFNAAQHAVIVDDVITTGATVSAVAKILKSNGASRVDVYALAAVV